jgi:ribosomal protein S24E
LSSNLSAQGLFGKLLKSKSDTTKVEKTAESSGNDTTTVKNKIKKSDIPAYKAQKVYVLDENNQRIKNEDGTDKYIVELIRTSDGARVSPEVAETQSKQINQAILSIAGKAAMSTGIGALSGGAKGALIGLAAGLGLSVNDIILIVKLKKDINKQKKALEEYRKSFACLWYISKVRSSKIGA